MQWGVERPSQSAGVTASLRRLRDRARLSALAAGALLLIGIGSAAGPGAERAVAAAPIQLGFAEPSYMSPDPAVRDRLFDEGVSAGANWARIGIGWAGIAPVRPAAPTDPGDPVYRWGGVDAALRDAAARGQAVMVTLVTAPSWAEGAGRPGWVREGTWKPDPAAFARFGRALATRYDGRYPDPLRPGYALPRVKYFEAWNEPNLANFLSPQEEGGQKVAAAHYARMLRAFYPAVHAAQPDAVVIAGSMAPIGSERPGGIESVGPLKFLRQLLCVERRHRQTEAGEALRPDCAARRARTSPDQHHRAAARADGSR